MRMKREKRKSKAPTRTVSGELEGPSGSKAEYGCTIRFGLDAEDFPLNKSFRPRPRPRNHTKSVKS